VPTANRARRMKVAVAVVAAALGLFLIWIGSMALWIIFSQMIDGTDKEGTNIYLAPLYLLIGAGGVALLIPAYRLAPRSAR
jgi:hypothetical protein